MSGKEQGGCVRGVFGLLQVLIVTPMWYVLLFHLLSATDSPGWVWALYWVYVPAGILFGVLSAVICIVLEED